MWEKIRVKLKYAKCLLLAIRHRKKIKYEKGKKYAFIMLAANYNNLGDIAITIAQRKFLEEYLSNEYQIIEIPCDETYAYFFNMKRHVKHNSIITIVGGGHNGSLYEFAEMQRRFIMKMFKKNIIISFPQSYLFEKNKRNLAYQNEFITLCKKCRHLYVYARERESFEIYKSILPEGTYLALIPDMVFYLDTNSISDRKEHVTFILRKDKEKSITIEKQLEIENELKNMYKMYSYSDTTEIDVKKENPDKIFYEYIDNLKQTGVVLTDRLHGMIISYITNTPCIVILNNNHKIKSTFETWLNNQNFIKLYEDKADKEFCFNIVKENIADKFLPLVNVLNECQNI